MTHSQQALEALNDAFSRKYHSLATYIMEARPFVPQGRGALLAEIELIAASDRAEANRLAADIEEFDAIAQPKAYAPEVANLNYLSLDYLTGILLEDQEAQLQFYRQALQSLADEPEIRKSFERLTRITRQNLERLQARHREMPHQTPPASSD